MVFFSICPRNKKYLDLSFGYIPLKVVYGDGVEIDPDFKVDISDLNKGYKNFHMENGKADSFKLSVIIHKNDTAKGRVNVPTEIRDKDKTVVTTTPVEVAHAEIDGEDMVFEQENIYSNTAVPSNHSTIYEEKKIIVLLNYFMRTATPFYIKSGIFGINHSVPYLITNNPARKQKYHNYVIWDLTFTRYDKLTWGTFSKTTKGIEKALKKLKQSKSKASNAAKAKTAVRQKLAKCKYKNIKYSKKKKVVGCVKLMQNLLYKEKFLKKDQVDGWYGKVTFNAVKKYQRKYSRTYGLKVTGHCNLWTWRVMCGKGKKVNKRPVGQIGATRIIKQDTKGLLKPIK